MTPAYAPLLARLRPDLHALVAEVVQDVALPDEDRPAVAASVGPVVTWLLDALSEAEVLSAARAATLRDEGSAAAIRGEPLQRLLDRYLSTGWVLWGAATRAGAGDPAIPALGTALLKVGDAAAAALAGAFGEAERALAVRASGARRELLDDLLDLSPADAEGAARLRRRAADFGLDLAAPRRVVVATLGREIDDGTPEMAAIAEAFVPAAPPLPRRRVAAGVGAAAGDGAPGGGAAPAGGPAADPAPLAAARRGRVVVVAPGDRPVPAAVAGALDGIAPEGWLAVASPPVAGLLGVGAAWAVASDALAVAERLGRTGLVAADDLLLDRALLADEALLVDAVRHELGAVAGAPRNGAALMDTLVAYLATGANLRATARTLGVAARTVAYRLKRIEELLGGPLRGERLLRVAAALHAARLLAPAATAAPAVPATPAGPPPRGPRGRSRRRPPRGRAT